MIGLQKIIEWHLSRIFFIERNRKSQKKLKLNLYLMKLRKTALMDSQRKRLTQEKVNQMLGALLKKIEE